MKKQDKLIALNDKEIVLLNEVLSMNEYEFYKDDKIKKSELCSAILNKIINHI